MDYYKGHIPILDEASPTDRDVLFEANRSFGLVPRDYSQYPEPMFSQPPKEMVVIEENEWDARYDEQEVTESSLEHIYLRGGKPAFTNLDQDGDGDCWAYSTGHAKMLSALRDRMTNPATGQVYRLNPHFIAAYLREYNGGWCGASAKVIRDVGILEEGNGPDQWPIWSHNTSAINQTRLARADFFRTTEDWFDMTRQVYDQKMTKKQCATCTFNNIPCPNDFNWWGHSVCSIRWVRLEAGSWGNLILNSWKNWGRFGLAVLRGSQSIPNGAVGVRF